MFTRKERVEELVLPGGRPASAQISANNRALSLVYVAGFRTTVLPMANAGHTCREILDHTHWGQRSNLPGEEHERKVPRNNGTHHSNWSPPLHLFLHQLGPA